MRQGLSMMHGSSLIYNVFQRFMSEIYRFIVRGNTLMVGSGGSEKRLIYKRGSQNKLISKLDQRGG